MLEIRHESSHVEVSNHGIVITDYSHRYIFALSVGLLEESKYIACITVAEPDDFKAVAPFVCIVEGSLSRFLACKPDIQRSFAEGDPRTSAVKGEVGPSIETRDTDTSSIVERLIGVVVSVQADERRI